MSATDSTHPGGVPLPLELDRALRHQLQPGERVVWTGRPHLGAASKTAVPAMVFGVVLLASAAGFAAIVVSWIVSRQASGAPVSVGTWLPAVFMIPFVVTGLLMISRPRRALRQARTTVYAVTDRRAIVLSARRPDDVRAVSFAPDRLHPMIVRQREDGTGSVFFAWENPAPTDPESEWSVGRQPVRVGFLNIEHPRKIEHLIRATLG